MASTNPPTRTNDKAYTFHPNDRVSLLITSGEIIGEASLFADDNGNFGNTLHCQELTDLNKTHAKQNEDFIIVKIESIQSDFNSFPVPYTQPGAEPPFCIAEMYVKQRYLWDINMIKPVSTSHSISAVLPTPTPTPIPETQTQDDRSPPSKRRAMTPDASQNQIRQVSNMVITIDDQDDEDDDDDHDTDVDLFFDEGDAAPISIPAQSVFDDSFAPNDYNHTKVFTSINRLNIPENKARDVNSSHVRTLVRDFNKYGYIESHGEITVIGKDCVQTQTLHTMGATIDYDVYVVDGLHRLTAFKYLQEHDHDNWNDFCNRVPVCVWTRKDGNEISFLQVLAISNLLNHGTQQFQAITFQDSIYTAMSAARILSKQLNKSLATLTTRDLALCLNSSKALGRPKLRQLQKYSQVALRLVRSDAAYRSFIRSCKACPKLSLVHLSSDILLDFDDDCFKLALQCLSIRMKENMVGRFDDIRKPLFMCIKKMYDVLVDVAKTNNKAMVDIFKTRLQITKTESLSVQQYISRQLCAYRIVQNQEQGDNTRIKSLKRHLHSVYCASVPPNIVKPKAKQQLIEQKRNRQETSSDSEQPEYEATANTQQLSEQVAPSTPGTQKLEGNDASTSASKRVRTPPPRKSKSKPKHSSSEEEYSQVIDVEVENNSAGAARKQHTPRTEDAIQSSQIEPVNEIDAIQPVQNPKVRLRRSSRVKQTLQSTKTDSHTAGTPDRSRRSKDYRRKSSSAARKERQIVRISSVQQSEKNTLIDLITRLPESIILEVMKQSKIGGVINLPSGANDSNIQVSEYRRAPIRFNQVEDSFNDTVPPNLPFGYTQEESNFVGSSVPVWVTYANIVPSKWPQHNPIQHHFPWLNFLYLPKQNRVNVFCRDTNLLKMVHHSVFWHAAFNKLLKKSRREMEIAQITYPELVPLPHIERVRRLAILEDTAALEYFGEKRIELIKDGYTIMEGFFMKQTTENLPSLEKNLFNILNFFIANFLPITEKKKKEVMNQDGNGNSIWNFIVNEGKDGDEESWERGIGRCQSSNYFVMNVMESEQNVSFAKSKAILELFICQIMVCLKVADNLSESSSLYTPKTGGRWLYTMKNCPRQILHTDFPTLSHEEMQQKKCPGYFTITTDDSETSIWVAPSSHRMVASTSPEHLGALSVTCRVQKIIIPPHSVFVGRGDLFHAGAAYIDLPEKDDNHRYHMYFIPSEYTLPDQVNVLPNFNPKFLSDGYATVCSNDEDENVASKSSMEGMEDTNAVVSNHSSNSENE